MAISLLVLAHILQLRAAMASGVDWALTNHDYNLRHIEYDGLGFIAVGSGGLIYTDAPDGVWKAANVTPATTVRFQTVAWNGVAFLAVLSGSGSVVYRSTDGINWVSNDTGVSLRPGLVVKDGLFYQSGLNTLLTSADGLNWTATAANISPNLNWDGTLFWSGTSHVSPDGIHWNLVSSPSLGTVLKSPTATISFSAQGIFR